MSASTVITGGYGTFGSVNLVITDGYSLAEAVEELAEVVLRGGTSRRDRKRRKRPLTYAEALHGAAGLALDTPQIEAEANLEEPDSIDDDIIVLGVITKLLTDDTWPHARH